MAHDSTADLRIEGLRPLLPPAILLDELPLSDRAATHIAKGRHAAREILHGRDDRLLVIVGPCSIHDPAAALDYGNKLAAAATRHHGELSILMRVYFEKPRTTVGWKGFINDPHLDDSFAINTGLRLARKLLIDLAGLGLPAATEFVDTITPQFIADAVAWAAIGARTTESPVHRQLASGLSMPVGFKNTTSGSVKIAIDAIRAAAHRHHFLGVTKEGISAIVGTRGNDDCHLVLRGGQDGPNYDAAAVASAVAQLDAHKLPARVLIDCSHGNSGKDPARQPEVARNIAAQVAGGSKQIFGVMIESHLVAGRQDLVPGKGLAYGQSITDACIDWPTTDAVLTDLAAAVKQRRAAG